MAYDKVVDSAVLNNGLKSIADAIREKAGLEDNFTFPTGFVEAIAEIEAGGGAKIETSTLIVSEKTSPPFVIQHGLGVIPDFYLIWKSKGTVSADSGCLNRMSLLCPVLNNTETYLASVHYVKTYNQQLGGVNGGYKVTDSINTRYNTLVCNATDKTFTYAGNSSYDGDLPLSAKYEYTIVVGRLFNE